MKEMISFILTFSGRRSVRIPGIICLRQIFSNSSVILREEALKIFLLSPLFFEKQLRWSIRRIVCFITETGETVFPMSTRLKAMWTTGRCIGSALIISARSRRSIIVSLSGRLSERLAACGAGSQLVLGKKNHRPEYGWTKCSSLITSISKRSCMILLIPERPNSQVFVQKATIHSC